MKVFSLKRNFKAPPGGESPLESQKQGRTHLCTKSTPLSIFTNTCRIKMKLGTDWALILKFRKMRLARASACSSAPALWFIKPRRDKKWKKMPEKSKKMGLQRLYGVLQLFGAWSAEKYSKCCWPKNFLVGRNFWPILGKIEFWTSKIAKNRFFQTLPSFISKAKYFWKKALGALGSLFKRLKLLKRKKTKMVYFWFLRCLKIAKIALNYAQKFLRKNNF